MTLDQEILEATVEVVARLEAAWATEKVKLDRTVAQAAAAKQPIMNGAYWQEEWRARQKLTAARALLEAMTVTL